MVAKIKHSDETPAGTSKPAGVAVKPRVALILQGGGALGAYHIGAYQALHEAGLEPDWVAGISIGAINACILAGNDPADRLSAMENLWDEISRPDMFGSLLTGKLRRDYNKLNFMEAVLFGQPNFWTPRFPSPLLLDDMEPESASFCDTSPMRATLARLASFDRINGGATRISLGATKLTTGELEFFDNTRQAIGAEHVLASGSLPPGFPATRVGDDLYWDGGCVSNTPLDAIYQDDAPGHTLVFMIDLWDAHGPAPRNMDQVSWRQNQILYSSRTAHHIEALASRHNHRRTLHSLAGKADIDVGSVSDDLDLASHNGKADFDIVHVIYHPGADQIADSDAEFSRPSIAERRAAGYADLKLALRESPWTRRAKAAHVGSSVHVVRGGEVDSRNPF